MAVVWRRWYRAWLARRLPPAADITLSQRRVFIFPTGYGFLFLLLALILFIGGINYENNLVMGFSFLLFAIFCIGILHTFRNLSGLRIRVAGQSPAFAGNNGRITLHLSARRPHIGIRCFWIEDSATEFTLDTGEETRVSLSVPLSRRGWNRPGRVRFESRFPLGLMRTWTLLDLDCVCLGWPAPLPGGDCPASGDREETGNNRTGQGSEDFAGLREYQPGDTLHRIDWKAYARGHGLNVRYFNEPADGRQILEWDRLEGMAVEQRLSRLSYWVQALEAQGKPWGLVLPHDSLTPATGEAHLLKALNLLGEFGEVPP